MKILRSKIDQNYSFFIIHYIFCPSPSPNGATSPIGRGFSLDLRQRQPHPSTFGCHLLPLEKANLCVTFYSGLIKIYNFALFKTVVGRLTSASLLL